MALLGGVIARNESQMILALIRNQVGLATMPWVRGSQLKAETVSAEDIERGAVRRQHVAELRPVPSGMLLVVNSGTMFMPSTGSVYYPGGATDAFMPPLANPRIDLVVYHAASGLMTITGVESANPMAPAYPNETLPIAEVRLSVGMSTIHGDKVSDVRPFLLIPHSREHDDLDHTGPSRIRVQQSGTLVGEAAIIDFTGNVSATNDPPNQRVIVEVPKDVLTINLVLTDGTAVLAPGDKFDLVIDFDCEILSYSMYAKEQGSVVVDLLKTDNAGFPSGFSSICGGSPPTLTNAIKTSTAQSVTGWTTRINAGDVVRPSVSSATTTTRVVLALKVRRL